jgi:RNase P/RNase MRP subunit p29
MSQLSAKQKTLYDLLYIPLIGKEIEIINSNNSIFIGIKGTILFESANFLTILTNNQEKNFKKDQITISLIHDNKTFSLDCSLLHSTLSIRLKKLK